MSYLEKLKQQMMVKPDMHEKQHVSVIIKGNKPIIRKSNITDLANTDLFKEIKKPIIIDKTDQEFDRNSIIEKLKSNKTLTVNIKTIGKPTDVQIIRESAPVKKEKPLTKMTKKMSLIIEDSGEDDDQPVVETKQAKKAVLDEEKEEEDIIIQPKEKRERKTRKTPKGIAIIGPESNVIIGDTPLNDRTHKPKNQINIKVSSYYMNNREIFVNFINSLFEPYKQELLKNKNSISCDDIGKTSDTFNLLTHQLIVRDYMNLYTPYRGLLLFHGLGSGKTATSIAIAEGMKSAKQIIVMTPASLRSNYIEELKKAGDSYYKKNQFWEWISTDNNTDLIQIMSSILNLDQDYITKQHGAWFVNIKKKSNFNELTDLERKSLDTQINKMIDTKYTFINYNGLRSNKLSQLTSGFTHNLFDNKVVVIDEVHNLISRVVNKIKKEKSISSDDRGEKEHLPTNISTKLYEYLMTAQNAKIVLLSGTPVINYPNEFAILFNILRGYIKTWYIPLTIKTTNKIDRNALIEILISEKSHDYLDYSPSSKILSITRNPFGFKNKVKKENKYQGVANTKKDEKGQETFETEFISDADFEKKIISILRKNDIDVVSSGIKIRYNKALPDELEQFNNRYIDDQTKELKNVDSLKRRIIGLSSYFRSAQENLLPRYNKTLGLDYHIVRIPMSDFQFKTYESARISERKTEKKRKKPKPGAAEESTSTYRIFSRLFCNYVLPKRPMPKDIRFDAILSSLQSSNIKDQIFKTLNEIAQPNKDTILSTISDENKKKQMEEKMNDEIERNVEIVFKAVIQEKEKEKAKANEKGKSAKKKAPGYDPGVDPDLVAEEIIQIDRSQILKLVGSRLDQEHLETAITTATEENDVDDLLHEASKIENRQDLSNEQEGEIEGDEILDEIGGDSYKARINDALRFLKDNANDYLTVDSLQTYSPKFLHMLENIKDPEYEGLHLVYSQFRTLEGIGIFSLVLEKNGFAQFKINKSSSGIWEIDMNDTDMGKPTFALYTGTESAEEKEIIRHIYNGEWDQVPDSISKQLSKIANNNNMGEIIKVFMITSSGSEGINLRNTRYVHIMEPYWHPVRMEQVIGRARRICSHKNLPEKFQTVEVFVYLMTFTDDQLKSDEAIELKRHDLSRKKPQVPLTSDQNLFEISEIKANLNAQLTDAIKETAFDCSIYSNGRCINFGSPTSDKFSYLPDYAEQQSDTTVRANKQKIEWVGKPVTINGVVYVYKRISPKLLNVYDKDSYEAAVKDPSKSPIQIGTLEIDKAGQQIFKQLVT
jgi:hypothetical protein